jgi:hypothetical protein
VKCPKCGLLSPNDAERCDCGYDFVAKAMRSSYLAQEEANRKEQAPDQKPGMESAPNSATIQGRIRAFVIPGAIVVFALALLDNRGDLRERLLTAAGVVAFIWIAMEVVAWIVRKRA